MDFIQSFKQSMMTDGIIINDEIIPDGKLHRFHIEGDRSSSLNGWYAYYNSSIPCGSYGCWKRDIKKTWCSKSKEHLSPIERNYLQQQSFKAKHELAQLRKSAKENAKIIWEQSRPAENTHPYLTKKKVASLGLRIYKNNRLVIPLYDIKGEVCSLQFISPTGEKRFLKGSNTTGGYYFIGQQKRPPDKLYICEGYATSITIYDVTNCAVVCCFNCNNILGVARLMKNTFPLADIIIAADNDANTKGNPGLTKAREAASVLKLKVVYPNFSSLNASSKLTDFNDMALVSGKDAVSKALKSATTNLKKTYLLSKRT